MCAALLIIAIKGNELTASRNDLAIDRGKWHFATRRVFMHRPAERGAAG